MGYCIQQIGCKFFVEAKYADYAAYRLWQHFFEAHFDAQGNIDSVWFRAEKLHDQLAVLKDIAPFVREGSYIEMQGEDYKRWRWEFDGSDCRKAKEYLDQEMEALDEKPVGNGYGGDVPGDL